LAQFHIPGNGRSTASDNQSASLGFDRSANRDFLDTVRLTDWNCGIGSIGGGRPVMLYFSEVPFSGTDVDPAQFQRLQSFRNECRSLGRYDP
jgi:hypothetical protein